MQFDLDDSPDDMATLHRLVRDMAASLDHRDGEIARLRRVIKELQRMRFGRRSERLAPDQPASGLEDLDTDVAAVVESRPVPTKPSAGPPPQGAARTSRSRRRGARRSRQHLSRLRWRPPPDRRERQRDARRGAGVGTRVAHSPSEYVCRCRGTVVQAPAPERLIAGGFPTSAMLAHALVSEYADDLPLDRQSKIFALLGVDLGRPTLAGWVGSACWWLDMLHERLGRHVFASDHLFADDTFVPVLDPGRGRTKTGRLWVYARDRQGWAGPEPPAAVFLVEPDRKAERPKTHLTGYRGTLHVDRYAGFERLTTDGHIILAACWAHTRRKFYEIAEADGSPIALEAVRRIAEIYAVETRVRGRPPDVRLELRRRCSRPLVDALRTWLEKELPKLSVRGKLAEAIRYALARWDGLSRFLDDGQVELDTNPVERTIRPVALGRKNHLFAGSGRRRQALGDHGFAARNL